MGVSIHGKEENDEEGSKEEGSSEKEVVLHFDIR
jgi:hypothetical protein